MKTRQLIVIPLILVCGAQTLFAFNQKTLDYVIENKSLDRESIDKLIIEKKDTNDLFDLSGANLSRAKLNRADLAGANLSGADLSSSNLSRAKLAGADLSKANLSKANLIGANLSDANLAEANLTEATLTRTNLKGANLTETASSITNLKRMGAIVDSNTKTK